MQLILDQAIHMQEVLGHSNTRQICQDSQMTGNAKPYQGDSTVTARDQRIGISNGCCWWSRALQCGPTSLMEQPVPIYKKHLKKTKKPTQSRTPKAKADLADGGSASLVPRKIAPAASMQLQCCTELPAEHRQTMQP